MNTNTPAELAAEIKRLADLFAENACEYLSADMPSPSAGMEYRQAREALHVAIDAALSHQPTAAPKEEAQADAADVQVEGTCVYVLNNGRRRANRWWAQVQPGRDDNGKRISYEECRSVALAIRTALSAAPQVAAGLPDRYAEQRAFERYAAQMGLRDFEENEAGYRNSHVQWARWFWLAALEFVRVSSTTPGAKA